MLRHKAKNEALEIFLNSISLITSF